MGMWSALLLGLWYCIRQRSKPTLSLQSVWQSPLCCNFKSVVAAGRDVHPTGDQHCVARLQLCGAKSSSVCPLGICACATSCRVTASWLEQSSCCLACTGIRCRGDFATAVCLNLCGTRHGSHALGWITP